MAADDVTIALGLPGFRVTQQRVEPARYAIWVEPTATGSVCPRCGQPSTAYHKETRMPLGNLNYPYTHTHIVVVHGIGDQAPNETALNFMNHFLRALPQSPGYSVEVDNLIESVDEIRDDVPAGARPRSFHPAFLVFTSDHTQHNYVIGFSEVYWQHITDDYLARNNGAPPIPIFIWARSINTRMLGHTAHFEEYRVVIDNLETMLGLVRKLAVIFKKSETFRPVQVI